jgi:SAM-dependent methyltransferase
MPTDQRTIDAYNKEAQNYAKRQRDGTNIYHLFLEKPALYGKLPELKDKSVLCIGCGSGEEVEYLNSMGTKKIVGIDISERLISIAKESYPSLEYHVMDAENFDFPENSFDLVFSSLTLHYLETWTKVLNNVRKVLKKNGIFLFSITHPFFSATEKYADEHIKLRILGYKEIKDTSTIEIYGNYLDRYKLDAFVSKDLTVTNYHRPLSVIVKEITTSGFEILDILEPKALPQAKERYEMFHAIHQRIPEFMIFELRKK